MTPSRTMVSDLLRNRVASTLPGGYWKYYVQEGDTLNSIVQNKVLPNGNSQQVGYYVQKIVDDVHNHLSTPVQDIFPGQLIYIPKRVA